MQTTNDYIRPRGYYDNPGTKLIVPFETLNKLSGLTATAGDINAYGSSIADLENADEQGNGFYSDLAAWYGNTKSIATMESDETWNAGGGGTIVSADTVNFKVGAQGLKIEENDNTGSFLQAYRNGLALDLTTLNNGEASGTDDFICFEVYVPDYTKLAASGYNINFSSDDGSDTTNRYLYQNLVPVANGFQFHKIAKSAFTVTGSPSWADIKRIRVGWTSVDSALGAYVTFGDIWLCKKDPSSAVPNPCQRFVNGAWTRDFIEQLSGEWFVGLENSEIVCRELTAGASTTVLLLGNKAYTDCVIYAKLKLFTQNTYLPTFRIDSTNYIRVFASSGTLYLRFVVGGTTTDVTTAFVTAVNDIIEFTLKKVGTSVTCIAYKNGNYNEPYILVGSFSPTSAGYLGIHSGTGAANNILSLSITATGHAHHADVAENAKTLIMKAKATAFATAELKFGEFGYDYGDSRIYTVNTSGVLQYWGLT